MIHLPSDFGMVRVLTCPQGHQWEASPTSATDLTCPVCGAMVDGAGSMTQTVPPQEKAAGNQETVLPGEALPQSSRAAFSQTVAGYEILGELGRGGMGVVYKARQTKLNRVVALKMILAGGYAGEAELRRFRTEAEAIARLQHSNIVQIHEVGEHDGLPFFALEFCAGGSLEKKLAGTPLPPKEAAALVETLARAMHAVHQQGIIHRDLKPANILLSGAERGARDEASMLSPLSPRPSPLGPRPSALTSHSQDHRFRLGEKAGGRGPDEDRRHHGHAELHGPRASGRQPPFIPPFARGGKRGGRTARRPLRPGRHSVRMSDRSSAVPLPRRSRRWRVSG